MKFTLSITCNNAAFHGEDGEDAEDEQPAWQSRFEVARILRKLSSGVLAELPTSGRLFDFNGNNVGNFEFSKED